MDVKAIAPPGIGAGNGGTPDIAAAVRAATEFEGFFIGQMLHQMRSAASALADEASAARDPVNRDLHELADDLLARQLAGRRAFGIADAILRQLLPTETAPRHE